MRAWYTLIPLAVAGCKASDIEPPRTDTVVLATGVDAAAALGASDVVVTSLEGLVRLDPLSDSAVSLDDSLSPVRAAVRVPLGMVVATSDDLYAGEAFLLPSPLEDLLPAPVSDLVASGTDLWLRSDGVWWLYQNTQLFAPMVDGEPLSGALVAGGIDGRPVIWAAVAEGVVAMAADVDGPVVVARAGVEADWLAPTSWGLIAGSENGVWLFDGEAWERRTREVPAAACGDRGSTGAWLQLESGPVWVDVETIRPAEPGAGVWAGCDAAGRLLTIESGELARTAAIPTALVAGLEPGALLTEAVTATLDLTHIDSLESVEVRIDGDVVAIDEDEGRRTVVVDPAALPAEPHALVVEARWTTGESYVSPELTFRSELTGPVSWADNVEPLYDSRCSFCHDNGTETILATQQQWEDSIESILTEVEEARMPLGGEALTGGEIAMIRAWRDGGFP